MALHIDVYSIDATPKRLNECVEAMDGIRERVPGALRALVRACAESDLAAVPAVKEALRDVDADFVAPKYCNYCGGSGECGPSLGVCAVCRGTGVE